ncbi:hypothetical protein Pint_13504 [Pistacia integerrima]|uniref:Uncharacterized protein n=1 Tax=Pistacia integerrima TaxID=434235 RepID=A0ACC0YB19_9ROSI|nr:hypothetical protein Pint_13504 [Pistacia integerrima]
MNLLLFNTRHSRVRASTISAIARFDGRYLPFGTKEAIHRCSPELWFVKVVCTLLVRSHFCLDSCLGYLSQNLTPLTSFEVGDMVSAESMRERMLSLGYVPDVVTFTSLIDGYFRNGQAGMPNEAFRIMQLASEDLNLAFPSLKKPMPLASTDIPVAP